VYLPELTLQTDAVRPNAWPTLFGVSGAIALLRPLIDAGLLPKRFPPYRQLVVNSGGGTPDAWRKCRSAQRAPAYEFCYARLDWNHKHILRNHEVRGIEPSPGTMPLKYS
jgi:N-acetyl-gamma-glutamylphosphate reductase